MTAFCCPKWPWGFAVALLAACATAQPQLPIARVEQMPNHPQPYAMRDWAKVARDYDAFVFDFAREGEHLPLIWQDETRHNFDWPGFGLPSYVGSAHQRGDHHHEAINCMAAVVGATLVGIDKTDQGGRNFALACQKYFSKDNGQRLYLNGTRARTGGSFWYETYPAVLFGQLAWLYPDVGELRGHLPIVADRMREAVLAMRDANGVPDFWHTAFDYGAMQPRDDARRKEPEAAAGYAWVLYMAHVQTGHAGYLEAADLCMRFLMRCERNPYYEVLLPYAATLAARMNAECGRHYDVGKPLDWSFGPSDARPGWGVIVGRWGGVDVSGLTGSTTDGGGYAFAMNTFDQVAALAPLARYDDRYARAIGKYVLNAANAARLFYANAHDDAHQSCAAWSRRHDGDACIAYEGVRKAARLCATPKADFRTAAGEVVSGDASALRVIRETPRTQRQVLREKTAGGTDALEHIWAVDLPKHLGARLGMYADCDDAGDADEGFRVWWSTRPEGPWQKAFTIAPPAPSRPARDHYACDLPAEANGTLYVKVEDTDRTPGQAKPDTLRVDALYVMYTFDRSPYAMGDAVGGPPRGTPTDFALYGASHVGYLGGIVEATDIREVLRVDLLKTDWYHAKAWPTYLVFNPHDAAKSVALEVGAERRDLYDAVSNRFVALGVRGKARVAVPADSAAIVVVCPAGAKLTRDAGRALVDGVVVDYRP